MLRRSGARARRGGHHQPDLPARRRGGHRRRAPGPCSRSTAPTSGSTGFVTEPTLEELVALGRRRRPPGGGRPRLRRAPADRALRPRRTSRPWASARPGRRRPRLLLGDDKLAGRPAGRAAGRARRGGGALERHPLLRALRLDKVTLAGLDGRRSAHYERGEALAELPVWRAMARPLGGASRRRRPRLARGALRRRAWRARAAGASAVGGGTLARRDACRRRCWPSPPRPRRARGAAAAARDPPVVGRIEDGALVLDPRTVPARRGAGGRRGAAGGAASPPDHPTPPQFRFTPQLKVDRPDVGGHVMGSGTAHRKTGDDLEGRCDMKLESALFLCGALSAVACGSGSDVPPTGTDFAGTLQITGPAPEAPAPACRPRW
ncbi:MAG: hypothetical protein MZW92_24255 [Comamonadaceae bacterium]|nr:hypothetical protein [Comamonadaceae bacterium]